MHAFRRGSRALAALALLMGTAACRSAPQFDHDGKLVTLWSDGHELVGFRAGDQGCVGWRKGSHRSSLCSQLLAVDAVMVTDELASRFGQLIGRAGLAVKHVTFQTDSGAVTVDTRPGDTEAFFAVEAPDDPVKTIIVSDAHGQQLRKIECEHRVGFPSLESCVVQALAGLPPS